MTFRTSKILGDAACCGLGPQPNVTGVDDDTWYDLSDNCAPVNRVTTVDSTGGLVFTFYKNGVEVPQSTSFVPDKPETVETVKFITNTVTGAYVEGIEVTDITNGTETVYVDGVVYTPSADEVVLDYVEEVALGNQVISVTGGTPATLTVPANASYAYMNINGTDAMYAFGVAPVANIDHRVKDGGRIEINSASRLATFQLDALDGASSFNTRVYFYNREPDVDRS